MTNIEQKYRKLDDIEHCLLRPGMYIGSIKHKSEDVFILGDNGKFESCNLSFNPGFLKLFDEIISNSVDEHRRNPKLNNIVVAVDQKKNVVTVTDNGGIPVMLHKECDEWIPEMIFSNLKAGSNFNDEEERLVAGTNGVGSTLTNIFSKRFHITTSDKKKVFEQTFTNNMRERVEPIIKTKKGKGFTSITYEPDLERFNMDTIDDAHIAIMKKRCVDLAACNPGLTISFNDEVFKFSSFKEYCELYAFAAAYEKNERWKVCVTASEGSFRQVSFVNSVETADGGTHVDHVTNQIVDWLRAELKKRHKVSLRPSEIKNQMFVMVQADIINPAFSSQTKEKLITDHKEFGSIWEPSTRVLRSILASEVVQRILDWAKQKESAEEKKKLRELNKKVVKGRVVKLIDAKAKSNRESCSLCIFEGNSAGAAFRKFRDPTTQGGFPLRGKFMNVKGQPVAKVMKNKEVVDLLTAIGLMIGERAEDLRYGKILIYADADPDGDSIAGLLINFFGQYWPELFDRDIIYRVMTPLVVVEKDKERKCFYTDNEFLEWSTSQPNIKKWKIEYKKGLAALEDIDYMEIIQNPKMFAVRGSEMLEKTLDTWFGDDSEKRKVKIIGEHSNMLNEGNDND